MTMSGDLSSPSSRGHLILKSHAPLPQFRCAIPVPQPTSHVLQLRNTVLAILTGQATTKDHTSSSTEAGLSYSEHLKQQTLHEWRLKGLVLELKQNALIAPETRQHMDDETNEELEKRGTGFVLVDDHECALLEHGDEINIWLREGQEIESLRLPKLSSRHQYGLPNQPALTRSGTLLGPPPPYSSVQEEYEFGAPLATLIEPREPSSHSSSVSAHPNGQYETTMRHKNTPAGWHRVLYLNNTDSNVASGNPVQKLAKRNKPKRLMSEGSNALVDPSPRPARRNSSNTPAKPSLIREPADGVSPEIKRSPMHSPPTSPSISNKEILMSQTIAESGPSKAARAEREKVRKAGQKSMPSQALIIGPGVQGKVGRVNSGSENSNKGATSTATDNGAELGEYGNMDAFVSFTAASSEVHQIKNSAPSGSRRMSSRSGTSGKDERMAKITEAFRASGEGLNGSNGRASGVSMASTVAANNATNGEENGTKGGKSKAISKRYVKLPEKPELPPIRNLLPFERDDDSTRETLLAMPTPSPALSPPASVITPNGSQQSERELQLSEDAALARALAESLTYEKSPSASNPSTPGLTSNARGLTESPSQLPQSRPQIVTQKSSTSTEASRLLSRKTSNDTSKLGQAKPSSQQLPEIVRQASSGVISNGSGKGKSEEVQLSKAEKRYNEVKKVLEAEKKKQAEQERDRKEKAQKERDEREKFLQKIERERRQKQEKARWEVWDEVRSRQTKEQTQ